MEFFRNAKTVRLKSCHGKYLCAEDDVDISALDSERSETAPRDAETRGRGRRTRVAQTLRRDWWSVELFVNSDADSVLRLKSSYGKYLAASDMPSCGMGGCQVVQSFPSLDSSLEWKPVMGDNHVKLRTHYGSFLNAKDNRHITHDISHSNTILWDVEVVEREQEGSATNVDDKALEEGSATKRRHETGEGSSVAKSPPGDSGPNREGDGVRYRRHFWNLKIKLWEESGTRDVLVRGGSGTTALVKEVCADVGELFDTVVWIGIPQKIDSASITEEMLLQLMFERMEFPLCFDGKPWMLGDPEFSLEQKARFLIVVDNLDDPRTRKKFEEILRKVKTCRVIFIARPEMGTLSISTLSSQIYRCGRESDPYIYEVEDLSYLRQTNHFKNFLEEASTSPSKGVCQLIVKKCERLPTAIVFVLREQGKNGIWEARIPSGDCHRELGHLQRALKICNQEKRQALETNYDDEDRKVKKVLEILSKDDHRFCFLYLSILPPNSPISCQRVFRLWAAERCLTDMARAEQFFKDLLQEKLIYPEERRRDGELSSFRVDNGVREIIASLSNLSNRVSTTSLGGIYWPEKVEYLSVQGTIGPLYEEEFFELSRVSALDVSIGKDRTTTFEALPLETSETPLSSSSLKHSKVLDLTGAPFRVVPYTLFELTDLRYLSLRDTSIRVIPRSIRKLRHLEFLDAKQSLVTKLPWQVAGLKKIRQILIYHHEKDPLMDNYHLIGFEALCRLGRFKCLEKLCFVEADEETLVDIGNLTKLMRLGITELREEHGELLCSSLEKLERLESLNLHASDEDETIDLCLLSRPPKSLKRLYLCCRLNKLPDWISSLDCLTKIVLRWSDLEAATQQEEDLLETLGKLPKLVELELRRAYNGRQLDFKDGQFPKLKILLLEQLGELRSMSLAKGTMPSLEDLTISRCRWLEQMPTGIEHLPTLQDLEFFEMSPEFYQMVPDEYLNSKGKPKVHLTRWRPGQWMTIPLV